MKIVIMLLLLLMIVCAISVSLTKGLLTSVVICWRRRTLASPRQPWERA